MFRTTLKILILIYLCKTVISVSKSKKKGLVVPYWPRHMCGDFDAFSTVSWWYNYYTYPDPKDDVPWWCHCEDGGPPKNRSLCFPSDPEIEFVPQIYGVEGYGTRPHPEHYENPPLTSDMPQFLGFNEPGQASQSNIPPDVAAKHWRQLQDQYPDKIKISPATAGISTNWMDAFMEYCSELDCHFDYIATHTYRGSVDERMEKLKAYSERYGGKKIWLTEFAVEHEGNTTKIVEFIEEFLPRLEFADFIYKYSWFYTRYYEDHNHEGNFWIDSNNSLMEDKHPKLTLVGQAYDKPWHLEQYRPKVTD